MMKITLLAMTVLALASAAAQDDPATPASPAPPAPLAPPSPTSPTSPAQKKTDNVVIIKQDSEGNLTGYSFDFELSDGQTRQEEGDLKNDTDDGPVVRGSYNYIAPGGQRISVTYLADKEGFKPKEHIEENVKPVPLPIA